MSPKSLILFRVSRSCIHRTQKLSQCSRSWICSRLSPDNNRNYSHFLHRSTCQIHIFSRWYFSTNTCTLVTHLQWGRMDWWRRIATLLGQLETSRHAITIRQSGTKDFPNNLVNQLQSSTTLWNNIESICPPSYTSIWILGFGLPLKQSN